MTITSNSLTAFEDKLKGWIAKESAAIKPVAEKFLGEIEQDAEIAFEELAEFAGAAVLKHAPAVISGTEKFGAAVNDVVSAVETRGGTVARQTAQTAVQQAYEQVRAVAATAGASQ